MLILSWSESSSVISRIYSDFILSIYYDLIISSPFELILSFGLSSF